MVPRSHVKRVVLVVGLAALAVALAVGVGARGARAESSASPSPSGNTVLRIGWVGDLDNMNPFIGWTNEVYEIYANEYLKLVEPDVDTVKPGSGGVAKSWEVTPDGKKWTFHLNEGLTWHDGEPLTSKDVAWTYNFIIDNEAPAFISFVGGIERVETPDDLTAVFYCSKPKANMLDLDIPILPEHIWGKLEPKKVMTSYPNDPPIVGSGPFQTVEWKHGRYLRMKTYDDFFLGRAIIDEIIYISYTNPDTMVEDLKAGSLDAAYLFPPAQYSRLETTPGIAVTAYTWRNWDYIGLNVYDGPSTGSPALLDQRFRTALEYGIDRDTIVSQAYGGKGLPGWSFMPPGSWENPDYHWAPEDGVRRDYDPERAKRILDEAGFKDTDGDGIREYKGKPITLRLLGSTRSAESQKSGKLIAGSWKAIGIDVRFQVVDEAVYFDKIWNYNGDTFEPDFDTYIWQWDGYHDPGQTLDCFTTAQIEGWNEFAWSNAKYDALDVEQNQTIDVNQLAELIKQMQAVMYEDAPTIVTAFPYKLAAYRTDKWEGWTRALNGKGPGLPLGHLPLVVHEAEAGGRRACKRCLQHVDHSPGRGRRHCRDRDDRLGATQKGTGAGGVRRNARGAGAARRAALAFAGERSVRRSVTPRQAARGAGDQAAGFGVLTTRKRTGPSLSLRMLCRCPAELGIRVPAVAASVSPSISICGTPSST